MMAHIAFFKIRDGDYSRYFNKKQHTFTFFPKYVLFFGDTVTKDDAIKIPKPVYQDKMCYPGNLRIYSRFVLQKVKAFIFQTT